MLTLAQVRAGNLMMSGTAKRILVVDDEANVAAILAEALQNPAQDWDLVAVDSPAKALALAEQGAIDLLITDYLMPGKDGLALIAEMQARVDGLKSILMTAHNTPELHAAADRGGVAEFLVKPFSMEQIRQVVEAILLEQQAAGTHNRQPGMALEAELAEFLANSEARCVFVATRSGYLVESAGETRGLNLEAVATLTAANFAAMLEIIRMLNSPINAFQAVNHESEDSSLYTCALDGQHLLVVIYDGQVKIGSIRYFARKAADRLAAHLGKAVPAVFPIASNSREAIEELLSDSFDPDAPSREPEVLAMDEAIRRGILPDIFRRKS